MLYPLSYEGTKARAARESAREVRSPSCCLVQRVRVPLVGRPPGGSCPGMWGTRDCPVGLLAHNGWLAVDLMRSRARARAADRSAVVALEKRLNRASGPSAVGSGRLPMKQIRRDLPWVLLMVWRRRKVWNLEGGKPVFFRCWRSPAPFLDLFGGGAPPRSVATHGSAASRRWPTSTAGRSSLRWPSTKRAPRPTCPVGWR